ncbi:MAG: hypothetical protein FJW99_02965 [Actinobacteria bacterium]|nr:hypothetical protein [Actinomycetota bacterium]MBM3697069.1 hypothetical protein [Actinomycetota bacterium]
MDAGQPRAPARPASRGGPGRCRGVARGRPRGTGAPEVRGGGAGGGHCPRAGRPGERHGG